MASPDIVNYSIRPNKSVERKVVFSSIPALSKEIGIDYDRYIGLGSYWFIDHIIAHRKLGINELISIEKPEGFRRATYNAPFSSVTVHEGDAGEVLPTLDLGKTASIVWLDYDSDLRGPVLEDMATVLQLAAVGTMLLVTVNAHHGQLKVQAPDRPEAMWNLVGDLVDRDLPPEKLNAENFPVTLSNVLVNHVRHTLNKAKRNIRFLEVYNFRYKDNAQMVTLGGVLIDKDDFSKFDKKRVNQTFDCLFPDQQVNINVPPLTALEKLSLTRLFPCDEPPSMEEVENLGFPLKEEQIRDFHRFYNFYPVFAEMEI